MKLKTLLCVALSIGCIDIESTLGGMASATHFFTVKAKGTTTFPTDKEGFNSSSEVFILYQDEFSVAADGGYGQVNLQYKVGNGLMSAYIGAVANAQNNSNFGPHMNSGFASGTVELSLKDRWTLSTSEPVTSPAMLGFFEVSASLSANSTGVRGADGALRDRIESGAEAILRITGTGIPPSPWPTLGIPNLWAYSLSTKGTTATGTAIDVPVPTTKIPVAVPITGGTALVNWTMSLHATANVLNRDNLFYDDGTAIALNDVSHTLRWGGITSVIDLSTGEPITDWTLTSDSGFDWTKPAPIPEPGTSTMSLIVLGALVTYRRRINSEKFSASA
ncbi:MAG: hypothetical protein AB7G28_06875 [Pirellulales bacterium]